MAKRNKEKVMSVGSTVESIPEQTHKEVVHVETTILTDVVEAQLVEETPAVENAIIAAAIVDEAVAATTMTKSHKLTDVMTFTFDLNVKITEKSPPQAKAVHDTIVRAGQVRMTGKQIRLLLQESDLLKTKQDRFRIFQYYRSIFICSDFMKVA